MMTNRRQFLIIAAAVAATPLLPAKAHYKCPHDSLPEGHHIYLNGKQVDFITHEVHLREQWVGIYDKVSLNVKTEHGYVWGYVTLRMNNRPETRRVYGRVELLTDAEARRLGYDPCPFRFQDTRKELR